MRPGFREQVEKNIGCAVILAGSDSDFFHLEKIVSSLTVYEIPFDARICSAHKQTEKLLEILEEYDALKGPFVYIDVAGKTDALSGTTSYRSRNPTLSCPPDHPNTSCITNPSASANAYIGDPKNVGKFIAQMYSRLNDTYYANLLNENRKKENTLVSADQTLYPRLLRGIEGL